MIPQFDKGRLILLGGVVQHRVKYIRGVPIVRPESEHTRLR